MASPTTTPWRGNGTWITLPVDPISSTGRHSQPRKGGRQFYSGLPLPSVTCGSSPAGRCRGTPGRTEGFPYRPQWPNTQNLRLALAPPYARSLAQSSSRGLLRSPLNCGLAAGRGSRGSPRGSRSAGSCKLRIQPVHGNQVLREPTAVLHPLLQRGRQRGPEHHHPRTLVGDHRRHSPRTRPLPLLPAHPGLRHAGRRDQGMTRRRPAGWAGRRRCRCRRGRRSVGQWLSDGSGCGGGRRRHPAGPPEGSAESCRSCRRPRGR
ncbi:hypothetical protein MBT84_38730 [Streptomyces sp. MBT84]|nr:hypothetical protein [Streptomyces sp. MBT84]